jgi:hypothetical protein
LAIKWRDNNKKGYNLKVGNVRLQSAGPDKHHSIYKNNSLWGKFILDYEADYNDWHVQPINGKEFWINSIDNIIKAVNNEPRVRESVNENFSNDDIAKIKGAVESASSFMGIGSELKKLGMKYNFATEPLPLYMIKKGSKTFVLVNKKYADKPDFVVGDTAGGLLESKSVNEVTIRKGTKIRTYENGKSDIVDYVLEKPNHYNAIKGGKTNLFKVINSTNSKVKVGSIQEFSTSDLKAMIKNHIASVLESKSVNEVNTIIKSKDGKLHNYPNLKKNDVINFLTKKGMNHVSNEKDLKSNMDFYIVESVNEAVSVSQVRSTIDKVKKQLIQKWKQKGGYENFGEKEGRMLSDKFNVNPYGSPDERRIHSMIQDFENWAMNYDGRSESLTEGVWSAEQERQVALLDSQFRKYLSDKGIEPTSIEASKVWKKYGFQDKMRKIFGKAKYESVNETQFKSGDKVLISHPTMIKPFKGIVSTTLNAKGEEVLVLKGDKGVWDAKFAKLDESAILKENIQYSPTGYVKKMVNAAGKMVKDITLNGVQYRYNPAYKTYNSVKGNELLHKSHILGESVITEGNAFGMAVTAAKKEGKKEFEFNGKTYKIKKGSYEKNEAAKKLAEKAAASVK